MGSHETDWQRRVASMLNRLMDHGARKNLPLVSWTVTSGAPQLMIRCDGFPSTSRPETFRAWKDALTALAGPPDSEGERPEKPAGTTWAWAVWEDYQRVRLNLHAEWDDQAADREAGE